MLLLFRAGQVQGCKCAGYSLTGYQCQSSIFEYQFRRDMFSDINKVDVFCSEQCCDLVTVPCLVAVRIHDPGSSVPLSPTVLSQRCSLSKGQSEEPPSSFTAGPEEAESKFTEDHPSVNTSQKLPNQPPENNLQG